MPAPRITTELPAPLFAGQSPGRGDAVLGGGGAGGSGATGAADDDPHDETDVVMPIADIARSIAELPTVRPMAVKKSRRANFGSFSANFPPLKVFDRSRVTKFRAQAWSVSRCRLSDCSTG